MREERPVTCYTVTLGELARNGCATATISEPGPDGEMRTTTLHVPAGLPGERVTIAVEAPALPPKRRKRHWKPYPRRVEITEISQPSPLRIQARCPVFGDCGGCQLQHLQYPAQLEWKREVVRGLLQEIGRFEQPPVLNTVPCTEPWHYRNQMRFSVNREGQPGLTVRNTHRVLPLTECPIAHDYINTALGIFSTQVNPRPQVLARCGTATRQILIQPPQSPEVVEQLTRAGLEVCVETMEEQLRGETFRMRPSSFFQTNTAQAEKMAQMVLDGLFSDGSITVDNGKHPSTVIDAYCGVGTFALMLARRATRVIAIEESASSIKDARWNIREAENIEILQGKVEDLLPTLAEQVDGLVIDPPRAGCQRPVLEALARNPVKRIVYVSCDPSTLARDLDILCHEYAAYGLDSVQPLDMFPQTAHIESVACLRKMEDL
ncbi:MAG TPA: class I SAM-dependent RNA methyltransferase [Ktedonobacteraceae bacterium]|nr:class I SAM-dependent RNA methyltransferase [Ktedonobacteraceae bacterium]